MRRHISAVLFLSFAFLGASIGAQDIITAADLFKKLSATYEAMADYSTKISIGYTDESMNGTLTYRAPDAFRIDFSNPSQQVYVSDGKMLSIYLPRYGVTYTQELQTPGSGASANPAGAATGAGLKLLKASYSINYLNGPQMEPLDEGSGEKVYKLKLSSNSQMYRQIVLSIVPVGDGFYIRRLAGTMLSSRTITIDFKDLQANIGVPDVKFKYDVPPSSNVVRNFLFDPEG